MVVRTHVMSLTQYGLIMTLNTSDTQVLLKYVAILCRPKRVKAINYIHAKQ